MRFAVVACSRCRRVQAVETRYTAPRCRGCAAPMALAERRVLHSSDDEQDVQRAVARLAAQQAGASVEGMAEALAAVDAERRAGLPVLLAELGGRADGFSRQDFEELVARLRVAGAPDRLLAALVADSLVFEPTPGRFRILR